MHHKVAGGLDDEIVIRQTVVERAHANLNSFTSENSRFLSTHKFVYF